MVYAPVGSGADNRGFIAGVFRMEKLADALIIPHIRGNFSLELIEDGEVAFSLPARTPTNNGFSHTTQANLPSVQWALRATPTNSWVEQYRSNWPWATFLSMLTLGLLVS